MKIGCDVYYTKRKSGKNNEMRSLAEPIRSCSTFCKLVRALYSGEEAFSGEKYVV